MFYVTLLCLVTFASASATNCLLQSLTSSEYTVCQFCATERFVYFLQDSGRKVLCSANATSTNDPATTAEQIAVGLLSYGRIQGQFWADAAATTAALAHLIQYMPIRDSLQLYSSSDRFFDFLLSHIRFALLVRSKSGAAWAKNTTLITDEIFLDYVLPYSFLDEKRDVNFFWRARFYQLFMTHEYAAPNQPQLHNDVSKTANITEAMHVLAELLPTASVSGTFFFVANGLSASPGPTINWESETSPMRMSPAQVIHLGGGSCTGTAIVLAAAARSVGIPARVVGCSQSIKDDDHHWVEFYDPTLPSPFGDGWHTKEGTSKGNSGGPWDTPSAPMNGCLKYLIPGGKQRLNTIWSSSWSSMTYMPLQWSVGRGQAADVRTKRLAFVGGMNACGRYCTAWGCGMNQTHKYTQKECEPN